MAAAEMTDEALVAFLRGHPDFRNRVASIALAMDVCEYLSAAALAVASDDAAKESWIEAQKEALKAGRLDAMLQALAGHCEAPEVDDEKAPVAAAIVI